MVIALADLAEAEGRELRRNIVRLGQGAALNSVAVVLAAAGSCLILWAFYQFMVMLMGPLLGALVTGVIGILSAGVLIWIAQLIIR